MCLNFHVVKPTKDWLFVVTYCKPTIDDDCKHHQFGLIKKNHTWSILIMHLKCNVTDLWFGAATLSLALNQLSEGIIHRQTIESS